MGHPRSWLFPSLVALVCRGTGPTGLGAALPPSTDRGLHLLSSFSAVSSRQGCSVERAEPQPHSVHPLGEEAQAPGGEGVGEGRVQMETGLRPEQNCQRTTQPPLRSDENCITCGLLPSVSNRSGTQECMLTVCEKLSGRTQKRLSWLKKRGGGEKLSYLTTFKTD